MRSYFAKVIVAALAVLAAPALARAYTDPGAGSMLLQLLLGGAAGLFVAVRMFKDRILRFFGFGKSESAAPDPLDTPPTD
ncbi:MAG: hypothetical protein ACRD4D_03845 [Candidatus Acidiferrales bacterium]